MKKIALIMLVLLIAACSKDEIIIKKHGTVLDTVKVEHIKNLRDLNTQIVYDTIRNVYYDTIRNIVNDTTHTTKYDTVTVHTTQIKYDTIWAYDTKIKYDTIKVKVNDTVYTHITVKDTVWAYETEIKYDTIKVKVNDTVWTYQTETRYETTHVVVKDTIHVIINDTITIIIHPNIATIKYIFNDNTTQEISLEVEKGKPFNLKSDLERDGYTFLNWNTQVDGNGCTYSPGEEITITDNIILYGIWKKINGLYISEIVDYLSTITEGELVDITILDKNPDFSKLQKIIQNYKYKFNINLENCTDLTEIPNNALYDCLNLTKLVLPNTVTKIGDWALAGNANLSEIILPNNLIEIGEYAIRGCFESITLPESLSIMGYNAIWGNMKEITIPGKVKELTDYAVLSDYLEEITIEDGVEIIGEFARQKITTLTLPKSVKQIKASAFSGLNLTSLILEGDTPPSIPANEKPGIGLYYRTQTSAWVYKGTTIYVPRNSLETYLGWPGWKELTDYIVWY